MGGRGRPRVGRCFALQPVQGCAGDGPHGRHVRCGQREDMVGPDGTRYPNHSIFREITPLSRLVFDHGDGERMWFEATITLQDAGKGTLITLRQLYPSRESRDEVVSKYGAVEGGKQHLAKLEAYIKANFA